MIATPGPYSRLLVAGSVSHSIAILCTVFRLAYRGWMHCFWWEDAWAALALIADVVCLLCIWLGASIRSTWVLAVAFTCVLWSARMSVIFSIIRIGNPSGSSLRVHKQIIYLIAASFACMWAALLVQKINICLFHSCNMDKQVAISQLITDIVADVSLVAAPLHLLKNVGLSRSRKILVLSAFGASLLITIFTIPHSILLFKPIVETTLIFAHVKVALSLIICNLLVIVTFLYRVCWKERFDLDQSFASPGVFSSVVMAQFSYSTNPVTSLSVQERITPSETTPVQTETTKAKMEEDTDIDEWPETLRDVEQ